MKKTSGGKGISEKTKKEVIRICKLGFSFTDASRIVKISPTSAQNILRDAGVKVPIASNDDQETMASRRAKWNKSAADSRSRRMSAQQAEEHWLKAMRSKRTKHIGLMPFSLIRKIDRALETGMPLHKAFTELGIERTQSCQDQ